MLQDTKNNTQQFGRGAEWRIWDLHIHTPASFHWDGKKFGNNETENNALVDQMINAMNKADASVFALMDYWTFDGWFKLKHRLQSPDAPKLLKKVFPGIELRLAAPMTGRLNAHVIFSDEINDQELHDFKAKLKLELIDRPLSQDSLRAYARYVGADLLQTRGYKKLEVDADDTLALAAGHKIAELTVASYKEAINAMPQNTAIGFMPFTTNDGLSSVDQNKHYAYALGLFQSSPIFETRDSDMWASFVGIKTDKNQKYFDNFQSALKNIPRLAVSGSDAHRFTGAPGDWDKRGYGVFPGDRKTWIKADPTWMGLLQAIKEPAKRSFIGLKPEKLIEIENNKTFYIDKVEVKKTADATLSDRWLDGTQVNLNSDLVAIIGNKGSGKSALADVIALLGNSQQSKHFSFLKKNRFRGRNDAPAKFFKGEMFWKAGDPTSSLLSENPSDDKVELVKYIPQGRFEDLCNAHVSGSSDAFELELRDVIFSHVSRADRGEALDFNQLIESQEANYRSELSEKRKNLSLINQSIVRMEEQLHPTVTKRLNELLSLKVRERKEHEALKPAAVSEPTQTLSEEQKVAQSHIEKLDQKNIHLQNTIKLLNRALQSCSVKLRAASNIRNQIKILKTQLESFNEATEDDFRTINIPKEDVIKLKLNLVKVEAAEAKLKVHIASFKKKINEREENIRVNVSSKSPYAAQLNGPQREYQAYKVAENQWRQRLQEIDGDVTLPDSRLGLEKRISQINVLPELLKEKNEERLNTTRSIFEILMEQRDARAKLFLPLQKVIEDNELIQQDYQLAFKANLDGNSSVIATNIFDSVKQSSGELRGEDKSYAAINQRYEEYDFIQPDDAANFTASLAKLLEDSAGQRGEAQYGIHSLLRKDKSAKDVYDYIFGLEYITPKYTLSFQETEIEQLSPGQRGALLLIFYLLVDKGRNPIVLDQPEENLDNETVVNLLVPVLDKAKNSRQIIMVTHNPNLAVVCDAEQIIFASFERKGGSEITYTSGSIESPLINKCVVDVLEGTKRAFDNRGGKYHP